MGGVAVAALDAARDPGNPHHRNRVDRMAPM
jgi:hypothetical protein